MPAPLSDHARARAQMVRDVLRHFRATAARTGRRAPAPAVLQAMRAVPREQFVPPARADLAYSDSPLAIGSGQTISQPFIVALMTDLLDLTTSDSVLEIGTGSGYQAAVLARLVRAVHTIEVVPELAHAAAERLQRLGVCGVEVRCGDGAAGWPEHAPYDAIIVTAACPRFPDAWFEQLRNGGRLVAPLGPVQGEQELVVVDKDATGRTTVHSVLPVVFVGLQTPVSFAPFGRGPAGLA